MSKVSTFERMFRLLTAPFVKRRDSNFAKLLRLYASLHDNFVRGASILSSANDLHTASGVALDRIGGIVGVERAGRDDESYRKRIIIQIGQNFSDGTINKVIEVLALTLNTDKKNIQISSEWENGQSATLRIKSIPYDVINASDFSPAEISEIVRSVIASGIGLGEVVFDGTFKYSQQSTVPQYDGKTGFDIGVYGEVSGGS